MPDPSPVVLALDLASQKTGWALYGPDRPLAHHTVKFKPAGDDYGKLLTEARDWLSSALSREDSLAPNLAKRVPTLVVYEAPVLPAKTNIVTLRKLYGLAGMVEVVCRDHGIECLEADRPTILLSFTGHGGGDRASRQARVKAACEARGWTPVDDNAADALALLDHACLVRRIPTPWPCGALFGAGRAA